MTQSEQAKVRKAREEDRLKDKRKLAELSQKIEAQENGDNTAKIQSVGTQMMNKKPRQQD